MQEKETDKRLGYVDYQNWLQVDFAYKFYNWRFWALRSGIDLSDEVEVKAWLIKRGFVDDLTVAQRRNGYISKWWDEEDVRNGKYGWKAKDRINGKAVKE